MNSDTGTPCRACTIRPIATRGLCDACFMYYTRHGRKGPPYTARMRRILQVIEPADPTDMRNPGYRLAEDRRRGELRDQVLDYARRHKGSANWQQAWERIGKAAGFPSPDHFRAAIRIHEKHHKLRRAIREVRAIMGRRRTPQARQAS